MSVAIEIEGHDFPSLQCIEVVGAELGVPIFDEAPPKANTGVDDFHRLP